MVCFEFKFDNLSEIQTVKVTKNKMKASRQTVQQKSQKPITSTKNIPSTSKASISKNPQPLRAQNPKQIKFSYHNYTNLTNQQYLFHTLKLLGVTQAEYIKQTKLSMSDEIFGKNQSASTTKQFFFIAITCLKYLCSEQEFSTIKMWYPPRTVNEQLQFKKTLYILFSKLQTKNKIPKNLLISKSFLMAETPTPKIVEFLRILSQLALRAQYLQKYSKNQRLIEVCMKQTQNPQQSPNDINRIYVYPFVPGQSPTPPIDEQEVESLKKVYKAQIEIFRKKILSLASKYPKQQPISCQQLMAQIVQQKQLTDMLNKKIPKSVLSDNRAFDRRKLIQQSQYVWDKLNSISCINIEKSETQSVLKLEGEIDKILLKWQTPSGINKMLDVIKMTQKLKKLKQNCQKRTQQFNLFYEKFNKQLKKYQ